MSFGRPGKRKLTQSPDLAGDPATERPGDEQSSPAMVDANKTV